MKPDQRSDRPTLLQQRFSAVMAADVAGYARLIADDPRATVADLAEARETLSHHVEAHGGRIADFAGDSTIAVFDTALGALYAAVAVQTELADRAAKRPERRRLVLRVGVHLGDILEQSDGSVYGDAVNIAGRLEGLAPPGGVAVSHEVERATRGRGPFAFADQGEFDVKYIDHPVGVSLLTSGDEAAAAAPSLKASQRLTKGNVPLASTRLLGRAEALEGVRALLEEARLVTLLGMGGMGKTRLSLEIGRRSAPDYPDGVWFADLAAVEDPDAVGHAVAAVFGVTQQQGRSIEQALVETLRAQRLLLILDNCEHVTLSAAKLADALLAACPSLKIVATSRETLAIGAERVWPLAPLETAGDAAPAVELFAERAQAARPDFRPERHRDEIVEICRALDGIPLAIELAAARARSLAPRQILARLNQRFRLLTGGSPAVRERHQTLLQAVRWSYDLLDERERLTLIRASVFAGGFTLEAAEAVCAGGPVDALDVVDLLDSLVRKSLVWVSGDGAAPRYAMLETIRAFGVETLAERGEETAARAAHARFFAAEADRNFALWRSPDQREAHVWLDFEINNLRNAVRWALETGDVDAAARIASSVGDMGRFRLLEEAANWAEEVVDAARAARHPRLAILLTWCASSAWAFQRFDDAKRFGEEAIALLDDPAFEPFVWAYGDLAFVALFSGEVDRAVDLLATGAAHPADAADRFIMAFHLFILASAGRDAEAREIAAETVAAVEAAGVPMSIAVAHAARGAALEAVDPAAALAAYESGLDAASVSGARFMETLIAPRIAALHARSGEPEVALQGFARMLDAYGDAADVASTSVWRAALVVLFARVGLFQAAATIHGTLEGSIDASAVVPDEPQAVAQVREALGERVFAAAAARGARMSLRESANYAALQVHLALASTEGRLAV